MSKGFEGIVIIIAILIFGFLLHLSLTTNESSSSLDSFVSEKSEKFLVNVIEHKRIDKASIKEFSDILQLSGYTEGFRIDCYHTERDLYGNIHQFMTSWEEILDIIETNNYYHLDEGVYLQLVIKGVDYNADILNVLYGKPSFGFSKRVKEW